MRLGFVWEGPRLGALALALVTIAGCSSFPTNLGPGQRCLRSEQCAPALACNAGMCTDDLTGFGTGNVPSGDAGMMFADAAIEDGGALDSGAPIDAAPPIDSGAPEPDAGPPELDSGPPELDAGPPELDSGPPEVDAGMPEPDAGPGDVDAGA